jgi:cellulose synthase/poly-beta-1,6-N-acetylglucosamine synthase-like glycosyltransferase
MLFFIEWFASPSHVGSVFIFWLLTFALTFKLVKMLHEWYHYWSPSIPKMPDSTRQWKVDILTTACPGEPREMILRTLKAMVAVKYPHTNYLCDEGDDPELKQFCEQNGIVHVTRLIKKDAKAGNINNALQKASGDICVVLDPDHAPIPEFLDRVLPYFEDPSVGFVQCVQGYGNQQESFIARGAAEQTYHFYGPMMMTMNSYGTVQAIGANCTFRRSALDSIGGHAAGLSEDMHTAMQLHAKGWKSLYIPEILTRGLVPATLSAYYKQQLKWSRGTFELLFRTFPKLYKHFTWRQKLHYFTIPLYFLLGLINLFDIVVPLLALGMAEVPWEVNLSRFASYFVPLCILSLVIRLYAQRWLPEKHERGFHFAGGILRTATWWIFLVGFIYTIFKIKVPYIPTPKEDAHQNYVRLSIPNFIVLLISAGFVIYGLSIDWTPYSLAMASYSVMTGLMLAFTILMSQQKMLIRMAAFGRKIPTLNFIGILAGSLTQKSQQVVYNLLKNGTAVLIIGVSLVFLSYTDPDEESISGAYTPKELGGFYLGIHALENDPLSKLKTTEEKIASEFNVVSVTQQWNGDKEPFQAELLNGIRSRNAMPFISWQAGIHNDSLKAITCRDIRNGKFDDYLKSCASFFRTYRDPIFISFSPGENGAGNSAEEFRLAWQYLYTFFNNLGISNLTWVWNPVTATEENYYPGEKFVDWIGVNCLNYAAVKGGKDWYSFSEIYRPYRDRMGKFGKPVMITSFGAVRGPSQAIWFEEALSDIESRFHEIKSIILYNGSQKFYHKTNDGDTSVFVSDFDFEQGNSLRAITGHLENDLFEDKTIMRQVYTTNVRTYKSPFVTGTPGQFQLTVKGKPIYITGVAYNTAHDWRDGNMPLTRRQVEKDFSKIRDMGANCIRRYGLGIYDRNVLNIADEYNLNVLYGFWFDPKIDYYMDSSKVETYFEEVEEKVLQYKDHPAVIAWSLGNESWGLLKHRYAKPYLVKVRQSYVQLIERLAERIHELDPTRPVFTCIEHEEYQLAGELVAFHDNAPSVDVIGINSYYREQISNLNHVAWQFDSLRPYLVSEFGPAGYWDPKYNKSYNHSVIEQTDAEKASWYKEQWTRYVNGYRGYNVGGFAYCWHDRMEGSYTWFGLTDFKGRPKPAYYALKELWTKTSQPSLPEFTIAAPSHYVPGKEYTFTAVSASAYSVNVEYEWRLLKNEYLDEVDNIEAGDNASNVNVTIPDEPSNYRLYLYAVDKGSNRVTTASIPIKVVANARQ